MNLVTLRNLSFITICQLIVFYPVKEFKFQMQWDDYWVVINEYTDRGFTLRNFELILSNYYHGQYAPINELYYILIKTFYGYDATYFHIVGVFIHTINAILVYVFILHFCKFILQLGFVRCANIAFFTALVFSIHPLNLEPVAWIAASKILLYSTFYLLALICYIRFLKTKGYIFYFLTLVFFIVSFGAKEQAVTFPACALLIDYMANRNLKTPQIWKEKVPMIILSILFGLVTIQSQGISSGDFDHYSLIERFALSFFTFAEYIAKTIIPIRLSYIYPFPFLPGESIPFWMWLYPFGFIISITLIGKSIIKKKWLLFGLSFFVIHIVLTLNIIGMSRHSIIADRYAYLSIIGIVFIFTYSFYEYVGFKKHLFHSSIAYIYISFLAIYTYNHLAVWENSKNLKTEISDEIKRRLDYDKLIKKYEEK
ncbi:hypothetical protein ACFOWA_00150 [Pedobacter lithocola]|uniref:Glycosyltransferase RgtA/B/C/D-like domain-containing protein n=1 Tax=Pedobacter lithocola TaxID=1908239 RepID=A0ABV8P5T2_9SPHI